jgi:hypothetical protein
MDYNTKRRYIGQCNTRYIGHKNRFLYEFSNWRYTEYRHISSYINLLFHLETLSTSSRDTIPVGWSKKRIAVLINSSLVNMESLYLDQSVRLIAKRRERHSRWYLRQHNRVTICIYLHKFISTCPQYSIEKNDLLFGKLYTFPKRKIALY